MFKSFKSRQYTYEMHVLLKASNMQCRTDKPTDGWADGQTDH